MLKKRDPIFSDFRETLPIFSDVFKVFLVVPLPAEASFWC
jgi:hypothetical protein